jgi:protease IV
MGKRVVLELDLTEAPGEAPAGDPVALLLARRRPTLFGIVRALREAAGDPDVTGLVAKVGGALALARAQELRDAVAAFRAAGKRTVAWAETFGEGRPATSAYLLATAFDEIWLQPSGDLGLTGVAVEATFLRGALDKLGVEPQLGRRAEYKNAVDRLTATGFTDAYRETAERLAASALEQVVATVAEARGLTPGRVRELVDEAPLSAERAREAGLVDRIGYRDEVYDAADGDPLLLSRYKRHGAAAAAAARVADRVRKKKVVALVSVTGGISQGRSRRSPLSQGGAGSDTVAAALRSAGRSDEVGAVLLRVDSPGGSYIASDVIWREVRRLNATKPVVASMGDVAASGGYYVAMGAGAVVAQPGTITGSIGVFAGKLVTSGLLEKLGVGSDAVAEGRQALMFSPRTPFDEQQWRRLEEWLDRVYGDFTAKVAESRGMTRERVHELARGRVWTGADAHERGLVDVLGGLREAIAIAGRGFGDEEPEVRRWPQRTPADFLRAPRSSDDAATLTDWSPHLADAAALLGAPHGVLTMPDLRLR